MPQVKFSVLSNREIVQAFSGAFLLLGAPVLTANLLLTELKERTHV